MNIEVIQSCYFPSVMDGVSSVAGGISGENVS